uniref:Uncharacterized protein n=1 Tax=Candidatus Kentrum sp. TUN TaxID=2126343 RepID=A0A451B0D8_9GAMM|nr:MAG: hypothetical protein BECKTUN1418F_GA0071002_13021 [Candidatus Kentron sp. TUN]VFK71738.1 MAG: hypothetical protein BECKTUN1418E_GA0071001_12902 [Candidatus Kentron sp. TUN]
MIRSLTNKSVTYYSVALLQFALQGHYVQSAPSHQHVYLNEALRD